MQQDEVHLWSAQEPPALTRLKAQAKRFELTCTSTQWQGHYASYEFVCSEGHILQRTAGSLLYGRPPAPCSDCTRAATFRRLQILASWKGGACLEAEFLGAQVNHRMRCAKGHEWRAEGRKLLAGSWCPACVSDALTVKRIEQANARRKPVAVSTRHISKECQQHSRSDPPAGRGSTLEMTHRVTNMMAITEI
jgi:hypothetical protein